MVTYLKRYFLSFILVLTGLVSLNGQDRNPFLLFDSDQLEIPFHFINGLIVIEATLQNNVKVKLLVDTGAENLILFNKNIINYLGVEPSKKVTMKGADLSYEVTAHICRKISIKLEGARPLKRDFLVLDDNFLKIDQALGIKVDGLVGGRLFWGTVMNIDYQKQLITLHSKKSFVPPKSSLTEKLDLEMMNNKTYIKAEMTRYKGSSIPLKLLLDTGASMGLLIFLETHPELVLPDIYLEGPLGRGLGGDITGYLAKTKTLRLCKSLHFNNLVTNYQYVSDHVDPELYNNRNGILGNPILSKFKVTIDYVDQVLYLDPIKNYNKRLTVDKSGMIIYASGPKLNDYIVKYVLAGTPADEAGIQIGDQIKRVGLLPVNFLSLANLNAKFSGKEGRTLRFKLRRGSTIIKTKLKLKDYLKVEIPHFMSKPL